MESNLNLNPFTQLPMNQARNLYTYQLVGTIQSRQQRTNPKYSTPFYQLNIICQNNPAVKKIFVFQSKLTNSQIWNVLQTTAYLGKTYLLSCRNYRGSYYLIDWEECHD